MKRLNLAVLFLLAVSIGRTAVPVPVNTPDKSSARAAHFRYASATPDRTSAKAPKTRPTPTVSPSAPSAKPLAVKRVKTPALAAARPRAVSLSKETTPVVAAAAFELGQPDPRLRQWNLTLDVKGGTAFGGIPLPGSTAIGYSLFAEWRLYDVLSLGFEYAYGVIPGDPSLRTNYFDVTGRIYPFKPKPFSKGEWYLMGGPGLNLNRTKANYWRYRLHGNAGFGTRRFLSRNTSLDLAFVWDVFQPVHGMGQLSLKAGFGFQFGPVSKMSRSRDKWNLKKMAAEEDAFRAQLLKKAVQAAPPRPRKTPTPIPPSPTPTVPVKRGWFF